MEVDDLWDKKTGMPYTLEKLGYDGRGNKLKKRSGEQAGWKSGYRLHEPGVEDDVGWGGQFTG